MYIYEIFRARLLLFRAGMLAAFLGKRFEAIWRGARGSRVHEGRPRWHQPQRPIIRTASWDQTARREGRRTQRMHFCQIRASTAQMSALWVLWVSPRVTLTQTWVGMLWGTLSFTKYINACFLHWRVGLHFWPCGLLATPECGLCVYYIVVDAAFQVTCKNLWKLTLQNMAVLCILH